MGVSGSIICEFLRNFIIKFLRIVAYFSNAVYLHHLAQSKFSIKFIDLSVIEEDKISAIYQHKSGFRFGGSSFSTAGHLQGSAGLQVGA